MLHSEDVTHLFFSGLIAAEIWHSVLQTLQIGGNWIQLLLDACFKHWFATQYELCSLPFYNIWGIWGRRNRRIFGEKKGRYKAYSLGIGAYFSEIGSKKHVIKPSKIIKLDVWQKLQVGFFDGACANSQCGCGDLIVTEPGCYYHFWWESGKSSNNKAELIALWGVLFTDDLHVFGDSKGGIDWIRGLNGFQSQCCLIG